MAENGAMMICNAFTQPRKNNETTQRLRINVTMRGPHGHMFAALRAIALRVIELVA